MLEIFVGKHLVKINRLQMTDAEVPHLPQSTIMDDTLLLTFKSGEQYQLNKTQAETKLIEVFSAADFYTKWEVEEDEYIEIAQPRLQEINATITEAIEAGSKWFDGFMLKFDNHAPLYVECTAADEIHIVGHDRFYSHTAKDSAPPITP